MEMTSELELLHQQAQKEKKRGEMLIQLICQVNTLKNALLKQQSSNDDVERDSKTFIRELADLKARNLIKKNNTNYLKDLVIQQELEARELKRELEERQELIFNDMLAYVNDNIPKSEVDQGEGLVKQLKENEEVMKEVDTLKGKVEGLVLIAELTKKRYDRIKMFC